MAILFLVVPSLFLAEQMKAPCRSWDRQRSNISCHLTAVISSPPGWGCLSRGDAWPCPGSPGPGGTPPCTSPPAPPPRPPCSSPPWPLGKRWRCRPAPAWCCGGETAGCRTARLLPRASLNKSQDDGISATTNTVLKLRRVSKLWLAAACLQGTPGDWE